MKGKVSACEFCQIHRSSHHKAPLRPTSLPLHPWQKISVDLFQAKLQHFLVLMDYYSRYLELAYLPDISSATVIGKMKNMFARWGVPEEIVSNNGTQFTSAALQKNTTLYSRSQVRIFHNLMDMLKVLSKSLKELWNNMIHF